MCETKLTLWKTVHQLKKKLNSNLGTQRSCCQHRDRVPSPWIQVLHSTVIADPAGQLNNNDTLGIVLAYTGIANLNRPFGNGDWTWSILGVESPPIHLRTAT